MATAAAAKKKKNSTRAAALVLLALALASYFLSSCDAAQTCTREDKCTLKKCKEKCEKGGYDKESAECVLDVVSKETECCCSPKKAAAAATAPPPLLKNGPDDAGSIWFCGL